MSGPATQPGPAAILKCPCERCGHNTDHEVLAETREREETAEGLIWRVDEYKMIRCRGCRTISLQHEHYFSEDMFGDEYEPSWVRYYPPRLMRRLPAWIDQLKSDLQGVLGEVYDALRNHNLRLVAMGVRTVIDTVARDKFGDQGSFEAHLAALAEGGFISAKQRETLDTVVNAGHAASHRGFMPPEALVDPLLSTVEGLLDQIYISGPVLDEARKMIPPKPKFSKKKPETPAPPTVPAPPQDPN